MSKLFFNSHYFFLAENKNKMIINFKNNGIKYEEKKNKSLFNFLYYRFFLNHRHFGHFIRLSIIRTLLYLNHICVFKQELKTKKKVDYDVADKDDDIGK